MKKKRKGGLKLIALMVMIICGVVLYKTNDLQGQVDEKHIKVEKLNAQIKEQELRFTKLQEEKAYRRTKKYIEEVARTILGLYDPNDIIFKPSN